MQLLIFVSFTEKQLEEQLEEFMPFSKKILPGKKASPLTGAQRCILFLIISLILFLSTRLVIQRLARVEKKGWFVYESLVPTRLPGFWIFLFSWLIFYCFRTIAYISRNHQLNSFNEVLPPWCEVIDIVLNWNCIEEINRIRLWFYFALLEERNITMDWGGH